METPTNSSFTSRVIKNAVHSLAHWFTPHQDQDDSFAYIKLPGNDNITMKQIRKATKKFSPRYKIGEGDLGTVYKAQMDDGIVVAIRRVSEERMHRKWNKGTEFQNEVQRLVQVGHLNLAKFYGLLEHRTEWLLVFEYVPNGTLREHLDCLRGNTLDFGMRLDIAVDIADAVACLHTNTDHPIVHGNIKSSNVLLTENLRAKVADFGFAQMGTSGDMGTTDVPISIGPERSYLDPVFFCSGRFTEKTDVYALGVLLVELVTGRRPIEQRRGCKKFDTTKWAMMKFRSRDKISALDPKLERNPATKSAMKKIFKLSLRCMGAWKNRPYMSECAEILSSITRDYKELLTSGSAT